MNSKACQFLSGLQLKNEKYNNVRTSKQIKVYHKSNVSNVAYQQPS